MGKPWEKKTSVSKTVDQELLLMEEILHELEFRKPDTLQCQLVQDFNRIQLSTV